MGKLGAVVRREFMERVRTKWFAIATIFGPILFLGISVLPIWLASRDTGTSNATDIVIIDASGRGLGAKLQEALADSVSKAPPGELVVVAAQAVVEAESTATRAIRSRTRIGYVVLDSATVAGRTARYGGRNATTMTDMSRLGRAVDRAVLAARLDGTGLTPARIDSLTKVDVRLQREEVSERGRQKNSRERSVAGFLVAFLLYFVIVLFGQNVLRSVVEEKTSRVAEVVVASVKPEILLAGKVIGVGSVALAQLVIWGVSYSVLGSLVLPRLLEGRTTQAVAQAGGATVPTPGADSLSSMLPAVDPVTLVALLAFFVLGYTFYASLYAAVGSMVNSEQEAQQASLPVSMLLVASAVFLQPILLSPNGTMARVMGLLPFSAPIAMPLRMASTSVPGWEILASLASVALGCVVAIWLAARIYRVGLLMYGKRPTLREVGRWLTYR